MEYFVKRLILEIELIFLREREKREKVGMQNSIIYQMGMWKLIATLRYEISNAIWKSNRRNSETRI